MKSLLVGDKSELTKSEVKICDYLQEYMDSSIYMTVTEIANNCGVGEATVTRFCRKLGFRSFLEFKMTMVQEYQNKGVADDDISDDVVLGEDTIELIGKKLSDSICSTLNDNLKVLNYASINEATEAILNATKVYFVGVGYSGVIAEDAYYRLMDLDINSYCYRDLHALEKVSKFASDKDVLIIFSREGNTAEINNCAEIFKERNVKVISITENLLSKLSRISDITINYNSQYVQVVGSEYKSKIVEKFIIEMIYTNLLCKK